jgi:hypothetical protein
MGAFNGAASLHYVYDASGNVTIVEGDTDGDGSADFAVGLSGNVSLGRADFTADSLLPQAPLNLTGTSGADVLDGGASADLMEGGAGGVDVVGDP